MDPTELDTMLTFDERHWWYRGRRRVLGAVLDGLPIPPGARLLDAGCGSGRTLDDLALRGRVNGVDLSRRAAARARERGHDVRVGAVEDLPFEDATFDVVTCLDVIEHTPDDRASLRELLRVTRPGGHVVLTVPAHPLLWSAHDELNMHYRRYTRRSLRALAAAAGSEVERETYFHALLLAPAAALRWSERLRRRGRARSDLERTPQALNPWLEAPAEVEARLIAVGRRVPAGLSLLQVLRSRVPAPSSSAQRRPSTPVRKATAILAAEIPASGPGSGGVAPGHW